MPKLEKIYRIKDIVRRHKILVRYAEALKVHLFQAQKANGDYDYDKLTVLVFDAESARYKRLKKDMFIFWRPFKRSAVNVRIANTRYR